MGDTTVRNDKKKSRPQARQATPSTVRTLLLRQRFMAQRPNICADRSELVTASYKSTEGQPPVLRQALAFDRVLHEMPIWIQDGELVVGNIASRPRGVFLFPEYDSSWVEAEIDSIAHRQGDPWFVPEEDKIRLKDCLEYWRGKTFAQIVDGLTPDFVRQGEANTFTNIAMGKQGGIGHVAADVEGVLLHGLEDHIERAQAHLDSLDHANPVEYEKYHLLRAMIIADQAVIAWAERFAALAREQAASEKDARRKAELLELAEVCERVPAQPAQTFREALQTVAFIFDSVQIETNGVSIGTGRLDQYLLPFYRRDIEAGVLTKAEALELLECLWLKLAEPGRACPELLNMNHNGYPFWAQVTIGGQDGDGYDATNELSYRFLDITCNMQLANPTLSARIHKRTPEKFLMKCGEAIRTHGGGLPALFNDEVVIPSQLANVPDMTKEDAYDYSVIGCSEIAFAGRGTEGFAYQGLSCGRLLELLLTGKHPVTGERLEGGAGDMLQWKSAQDMMQAFRELTHPYTKFMFTQVLPIVEAHTKYLPCPYLSSVTRDCIGRGQSYYAGGAQYGNGVVNVCIVGIGTLGNALAAIRKLVFDDGALSTEQLKYALETNFEDTSTTPTGPEIRKLCLDAPKYGNDDPYVDDLTKDCLNTLVKELRKYETQFGGRYQATISPVSTHVIYGMVCGATPDGRKAASPLSEGCSPAQGTDVSGPTATVKSVANLEHINLAQGTIFNMKMHPTAFSTRAGMRKWADLVRTFFDLGGWEVQFNVVDADTLRAAQENPEQHRDLVVRVVGYSAFFVDLDKAVQDDIISRTEHCM